ncbi:MAG TPA: amidohydrolase family protein [Gemmatimonadales bacterium]|nr:amidohydrolase family protein [Gemmatimonadales bacterium]
MKTAKVVGDLGEIGEVGQVRSSSLHRFFTAGTAATTLAALLVSGFTASLHAQVVAITNARVLPVSGPPIENGVVLMRDGIIVSVGAGLAIPADARRVDARGGWVTPGFINAATQVGLVEIPLGTATQELGVRREVAAAFNVAEGLNPASTLIPVTRIEGTTSGLLVPSGSFIAGQSVFVDFAGSSIEDMIVRNPVAMHVTLDESSRDAGEGARAWTLARLRQILSDAREYARRRADFERGAMRPLAAPAVELEALQPVLEGRMPLVVTAHRVFDIRNALRVRSEFNIRLVLHGAAEAWQIAEEIAAAGVPVLVTPLTNIPTFNQLGARYENAARLAAAGVRIAIIAGGDTHNARLIRQEAGNAVSYGLPWEQALRAVTLAPAQILGLDDRYGSLQTGRVANVVVWSGDPFEFSTGVVSVFIRGREIPLTSRQTELFERYRTLPPRP